MQRLVTICLSSCSSRENKHGSVEEHLQEYLAQGWKVLSLVGLGGGTDLHVHGWLAVVLEK